MSFILEHVHKKFDNSDKMTVNDISLEIKDGEFICLLGPSGCGKSTLINLMAGLELPTEGRIILNDKEIKGPGPDRILMFQESALFPWLTVRENVCFGMKLAKLPKEEMEERCEKYLKMVHLSKFADYSVHEISGGMKQRAALARALCLDSDVLLMDEPFAALDKQTINILREEIQSIWSQTGKTIVFVTHSVEEALYFADRIVMMSGDDGRISKIIPVDIARPRQIDEPEFLELRHELLAVLRNEVDKIAKEEYDS